MHLLYCDDNDFIFAPDGSVYVEGQFHYGVWERYLKVFDRITVLGRGRPLPDHVAAAHLNRTSGPGVSFVWVPSLAGPLRLLRHHRAVADGARHAMIDSDAVIVRLPSQNGLIAARVAERLGKPWAAEVVGCPWDQLWNHGTWEGKVFARIQWLRMRRVVASSRWTLYVTRHFLQRRYPAAGVTTAVSNVDIGAPDSGVLEARLRRIALGGRTFVLGMIGSIKHGYKGLGTAIEALGEVRERLPEFEFRVLGQGDPRLWQEAARRHGLEGKIRFCGVLPSGRPVLDWLDETDLYLQPSFQEGLPRALIEAMSRGCPAVASTAGGIPELLPAECLHRPGDARRLADLIVEAAQNPDWRSDQARRNFNQVEQYARSYLETRRTDFWRRFAASVEGGRSCRTDKSRSGEAHERLERDVVLRS